MQAARYDPGPIFFHIQQKWDLYMLYSKGYIFLIRI